MTNKKINLRNIIVDNINKKYPQIPKYLIKIIIFEFFKEIKRSLFAGNSIKIKNFIELKIIKTKPRKIGLLKSLVKPSTLKIKLIFDNKFKKYSNGKIKDMQTKLMKRKGTMF